MTKRERAIYQWFNIVALLLLYKVPGLCPFTFMFTIVLLTIYRNEAPSAITILAPFLENKESSSDKIGISGQ